MRRIRHRWQVFGLAGAHDATFDAPRIYWPSLPKWLLSAMTAVVPAYRCGTVSDSHRVPSHANFLRASTPTPVFGAPHDRGGRTSCVLQHSRRRICRGSRGALACSPRSPPSSSPRSPPRSSSPRSSVGDGGLWSIYPTNSSLHSTRRNSRAFNFHSRPRGVTAVGSVGSCG